MKIKSSLLRIAILFVLTIMIISLVSCNSNSNINDNNDGTDGNHTHEFSAWTTTNTPTCTATGMQIRKCSCGYTEYDSIAQLPHSEVIDVAVAATCTTTGKTEGSHCSVCNTVIVAQTEIASTGHDPVTDAAIAPTCTVGGKTEGSHCSSCKTILVIQEPLQPLQHACNNVSVITEATCVKEGTKRYSCTNVNCNYYYDESFTLQEYSSTEIYNQALKYTGEILTYDKKGIALAQGTGFVCSSDGKIITNYHVIEGAYSATITIGNDTYTIQSVLAYDADIDLAVLKINATGLTPAVVCKNDPVTAEIVYAIGSPRGFTATVSVGIVSYAKRVVNGVTYVQHDADITHGSSGGPLINKYGEVIGVNAGAFGNAEINVAVFTGELDKLTCGTPITLAELYDSQNTPNDILREWLLGNYNFVTDDLTYYQIEGDGFIYAIGYDASSGINFIEGVWDFADGSDLYLSIDLTLNNDGLYAYYAHYTFGENENFTRGYINPTTYTATTLLTHYYYDGTYWDEERLMEFYSDAVACVAEWFDYCIDTYFEDIDVEDFGFEALEFDYNSSAISVLKSNIRNNGTYDSSSQWYEIEEEFDSVAYEAKMSLVYHPSTEILSASMSWFGDDGTSYYIYLSLSSSSWGNYYSCYYNYVSLSQFAELNDTHGYIDAGTFTSKTPLKYTEFNGYDEYEDELLDIYSSCLQHLLNWIGAYLDNTELGITLADLGFVFYDGYTPIQDCDGENHYYQAPTFTWVEDENGFNVTATFVCGCGAYSDTATTYVSNTEYVVTTNADETEITYAFTANIVFGGYTYTDTRYIRYEWKNITLNNANYKDYLSVSCYYTSYLVSTSVSTTTNMNYSNVSVTFTVNMTGEAKGGGGGMGYSKKETIVSGIERKTTNVASIGLSGYYFYPSTLTYSVAVSGQVSGYFMTEYLVS